MACIEFFWQLHIDGFVKSRQMANFEKSQSVISGSYEPNNGNF